MPKKEVVPDEFRCNRSDGKQWRCKGRAMEGKKMCETHHLQLNLRQNKMKVPESLKFVRSRKGDESSSEVEHDCEIRVQKLGKSKEVVKRKRVMGEAEAVDEAVRKMKLKRGDMQLDLIRMVLKREVEKKRRSSKRRKKKEISKGFGDSVEEFTRVLPNGIMAISPPSPTTSNVTTSPCDVKVGAEPISVIKRRFRSKNIEPLPIGKVQVVPFKGNLVNARNSKKKRCHWCGTKGVGSLICCLSCGKEFFCLRCIEKRNSGSREEVEKKCPVCRGTCKCKVCSVTMSGVTECKDSQSVRSEIDRVLHLHYAVCMLLPVLKDINAECKVEVENDTETKGRDPTEPCNQSSELTFNDQQLSHDTSVVGLHKRCTRSSSALRRGQDCRQGSLSKKETLLDCKLKHSSCEELPRPRSPDAGVDWSCTQREAMGCSENLPLRSEFSLEMTSKLEINAEQIVSCYELPEILDKFSGCTFCLGIEKQPSSFNHLKEASSREDTTGNFLYYPTVMELQQNNLEHFQTHWSKGHPVIVHSVLKDISTLNWDPIAMFCTYLMSNSHCKSGMDWFEVEIGVKQTFMGSFRGKAEINTCQEKLKLNGWLSPLLFRDQFPNHYAEVLKILPVPHYMDPNCGLLNIAANLPDNIQTPDLGPCLNISYRGGEEYGQPDSVKKLGFETCDTVDILLHVTETPVSTKQICRIRQLMKKKMAANQVEDKERDACQTLEDDVKNTERVTPKSQEKGRQSRFGRRKKQERLAAERCDQSQKDKEASYARTDWSEDYTSSDSESSQEVQGEERESCNDSCEEESLSNSYGAQWDVFQKQDASKLLDYMKKHSCELDSTNSTKKEVIHPLLEQSYYLDEFHKTRLKEEFGVEPWTFDQCVGEAVIIPAGCPYQIRKTKSCVNTVVKFLSPEHVTESIKRMDELNELPESVKTIANKIDVKKMAIHKISEAVKEIRELTSSDSADASKL